MTKRRRRTPEEREFTLSEKRDAGQQIKALLEHAAVQGFFDAYQKKLVREMIQMAGGDTEALRIAGRKMQALLAFKQDISTVIAEGQAAETQLAKVKTDG